MGNNVVKCIMIAAAVNSGAIPLEAQAQAVAVTVPAARTITVELNEVMLEAAIDHIARQAGLTAIYGELVSKSEHRVTLRAERQSAANVFFRALHGTGLRAVIVGNNVLIEPGDRSRSTAWQGTITGRVQHDRTRHPIANAKVTIEGTSITATTDQRGTFRLTVPAGTYVVSVRALGMAQFRQSVTVADEKVQGMEILLAERASVLDDVIVTGTVTATARREIATPITVITAADLERRNVTRLEELFRGEIPDLLALDVGTNNWAPELGAGTASYIYSRGSASLDGKFNPIKTYVDGVEVLDPSQLGTIDPQSIERIEIVTGPQAATVYGSGAIGGVMQIFTKKGSGANALDWTLSLKYGMLENSMSAGRTPSHSDALLMRGGTGPAFSYAADLTYGYTGQWRPDLFSRRVGVSLGATHVRGGITVSASVATTMSWNGTSSTSGSQRLCAIGSCRSMLEGQLSETGATRPAAPQFSRLTSQTFAQTQALNIDYRATPIWQHQVTMGRNTNQLTLDPVAPSLSAPSDTLFQVRGANGSRTSVSYNTSWSPRYTMFTPSITLGVSGTSASSTQHAGRKASRDAAAYVASYSTISETLNDRNGGGFAAARLGFADHLYLNLGVRAERNRKYGRKHAIDWTPTHGIAYVIDHGDLSLKLRGSYGRATRAPSEEQRLEVMTVDAYYTPPAYVSQFASPGLTPEYSRGPQFGLEVYYGRWGSLSVNRYVQRVTDLIQQVVVSRVERQYYDGSFSREFDQIQHLNVATIRQHGWSGTGTTTLGIFNFSGTYSWNESRVESVHPAAYALGRPGATFPGVPTHTGNLRVGVARGKLSGTWTLNYVGATQQNGDNTIEQLLKRTRRHWRYETPSIAAAERWISQPGYAKSNLMVDYSLRRSVRLTAHVTNLTNSFASDLEPIYPTLGRQALLGLTLRYP